MRNTADIMGSRHPFGLIHRLLTQDDVGAFGADLSGLEDRF